MGWTFLFAGLAVLIYLFNRHLDRYVVRRTLGIALFLEIFYLTGHYWFQWPFPGPLAIIQIVTVTALGTALGVTFARIWPLSMRKGWERVIRTLLLVIPSLGLGMGLQLLLQGNHASQALYLIFALASWLGSGHYIRPTDGNILPKKLNGTVS